MIALAPDVVTWRIVSERRLRTGPGRFPPARRGNPAVAVLQHVAEDVVEALPGARHDDRVVAAAVVQRVAAAAALIVFPVPPKLIVSLPAPVVILLPALESLHRFRATGRRDRIARCRR